MEPVVAVDFEATIAGTNWPGLLQLQEWMAEQAPDWLIVVVVAASTPSAEPN